MKEQELIEMMLPEGITEYFEVTGAKKLEDSYEIYLEEKNLPPEKYQKHKLTSKGFFEEVTIHDFPLRGKACYLKVKRRKWYDHDLDASVHRDWALLAKGTRMTEEFAAFLKGLDRQYGTECLDHRKAFQA